MKKLLRFKKMKLIFQNKGISKNIEDYNFI